jgi:guanosine-3',5'-bis(diphosphate) 3'-pyrophosphohydrolase
VTTRRKGDYVLSIFDSTAVGPLLAAANFAAQRHSAQRRKGDQRIPYINHPIEVARIIAEEGGVVIPAVLIAALLHDTVEDTETTIDEIAAQFGQEVASIVAEVTDDKNLPKHERKRLQVANASKKSVGAKVVKLADKTANLRDILTNPPADWTVERQLQYARWAQAVGAGLRGVNEPLEKAMDEAIERILEKLA